MKAMLKRSAIAMVAVTIPTLLIHPWSASAGGKFNKSNCTINGHKLYGTIREVSGSADVTVRVVTGSADLRVRKVTGSASHCGEWRMVTGSANTTVRFVTGSSDLTIRYTDGSAGPG
jgi:hypothetical protein